jgi:type IV secretory pathway component VirB8
VNIYKLFQTRTIIIIIIIIIIIVVIVIIIIIIRALRKLQDYLLHADRRDGRVIG